MENKYFRTCSPQNPCKPQQLYWLQNSTWNTLKAQNCILCKYCGVNIALIIDMLDVHANKPTVKH